MIVDKEYSFYPQVKKTRRSKTLVFNPCSVGKLWILLLESTMYLRCKFTHLATSLFGILCSSQLSHLVSQWILLKKNQYPWATNSSIKDLHVSIITMRLPFSPFWFDFQIMCNLGQVYREQYQRKYSSPFHKESTYSVNGFSISVFREAIRVLMGNFDYHWWVESPFEVRNII